MSIVTVTVALTLLWSALLKRCFVTKLVSILTFNRTNLSTFSLPFSRRVC